jgi:hypothetical protein
MANFGANRYFIGTLLYPWSMEGIGIVSVSNLLPTSKYVCARSEFWMVCSVGAGFILIRTERPYI